ncbi:MAG: hypothetical protein HRT68_04210 [Flavobacteriaceae bacterium]|nr:hypothetical protein [Flavobacteriaceae bacterium]
MKDTQFRVSFYNYSHSFYLFLTLPYFTQNTFTKQNFNHKNERYEKKYVMYVDGNRRSKAFIKTYESGTKRSINTPNTESQVLERNLWHHVDAIYRDARGELD